MARKKKYTREELIDCLKRLYEKTGGTPTYMEAERTEECPSVYIFKKQFGSWNEALRAAGYEVNNEHKSYTKEDLIVAIRKFQEAKGRVPTEKLMNQTRGYPSGSVYTKMFGSWKNALSEAGYDVEKIYSSPSMDKVKRYENETLLGYLKEFKNQFNEIPCPLNWYMFKDKPRREIYIRRFGSWRNALLSAGFEQDVVNSLEL